MIEGNKFFSDQRYLKLEILNVIRNKEPVTKSVIANELGVNVTTITQFVNKLQRKYKILTESGKDTSTGGRKPTLYKINKELGYVIGVDIGGDNTRVIITDILGNIISSLKDKTIQEDSEKLMREALKMIGTLVLESKIPKEKILGIGISLSCIVDTKLGYSIFCPNIKGLNKFPIKKIMEGKAKVPVFVDDCSRCMAIAEKRYGIAKDYSNFISISLGRGIGAGIFIDGKIYRGSKGLAGELGHITVSENGPVCNCGNKGCLETIASGVGIIRRAREGMKEGIVTSLTEIIGNDYNKLTVEVISKAAEDGDKFAYYIINRTGEYIGIAIATALNLFGSELVVLGGGISESGDILLGAIKRTVKIRALYEITKKIKIVKTELGDNIAALGAVTGFIDNLFTDYKQNILDFT